MCHDSSICGTDQTLQETTTTRRSPLRESRAHYIRSLDLCLCYQVSLSVLSVSFSVSRGLFVCVYPELWLGVSHCCLWMVVSSRKRVPARYVCLLLSLLVYLVSRCCLSMGVSCLNGSLVSQCESLLASGLIMCVSCFFYLCLLLSLVCSVYSLKTTARRARPYFSRHFSWRHPSCAPLVLHIDLSACEVSVLLLLCVVMCCTVVQCVAYVQVLRIHQSKSYRPCKVSLIVLFALNFLVHLTLVRLLTWLPLHIFIYINICI